MLAVGSRINGFHRDDGGIPFVGVGGRGDSVLGGEGFLGRTLGMVVLRVASGVGLRVLRRLGDSEDVSSGRLRRSTVSSDDVGDSQVGWKR